MTTKAKVWPGAVPGSGLGRAEFYRAYSPEFCLILVLLRAALGTSEFTNVEAWCDAIDWTGFGACVTRHRLGPFLHRKLPERVRSLLPDATQRHLEALWSANLERTLIRASEVVRLTRLLEDADIFALSVKGPLLARQLYGDLSLRHAGDIDLLVAPKDVDRADILLRSTSGYRRQEPDFELTPLQKKKFIQIRKELGYLSREPRVRMELMWRLEQLPLPEDDRWPAREEELGGRAISVLSPDINAHYLFLHGAGHGWCRLFWLLDVALLMADEKIRWEELIARARLTRTARPVLQGASLARELLGIRIPTALQPLPGEQRIVARLAVKAEAWMAADARTSSQAMGFLRQAIYRIRLQQGWNARFRAIKHRLVFVYGWRVLRLPDSLFALYYPMGPFLCIYHLLMRRGRLR